MKSPIYSIFAALTCSSLAIAGQYPLLPTQSQDFATSQLQQISDSQKMANRHTDGVQFSQPAGDMKLAAFAGDLRNSSRQYWLETSSAELKSGITLYTTAPGAVIRISAKGNSKAASDFDIGALQFGTSKDWLSASAASDALASQAALKHTGLAGNTALRLRQDFPVGSFKVRLHPTAKSTPGALLVHVFEPNSNAIATAVSAKRHYSSGSKATIQVELSEISQASLHGFVVAPDGESFDLTFKNQSADLKLPKGYHGMGLWEAHVYVNGDHKGLPTARSVRVPFSVATPTAKFDRNVIVDEERFGFDIQVASSGRYAVKGVLMGTNSKGALVPVSVAESAQWLEPGNHQLELNFANKTSGQISAPFEIQHLQLVDQSRMAVLHQQQRAVVIE